MTSRISVIQDFINNPTPETLTATQFVLGGCTVNQYIKAAEKVWASKDYDFAKIILDKVPRTCSREEHSELVDRVYKRLKDIDYDSEDRHFLDAVLHMLSSSEFFKSS